MNHDDVRRTSALWSLSNPGMGMSLRFLCPCCNQPRSQQGGKRRRIKGLVQLVCKDCCAAMDRAPTPAINAPEGAGEDIHVEER